MRQEQQRIAIAKACGWTEFAGEPHKCYAPNGLSCYWDDAPEYIHDLNSMNEAERWLNWNGNSATYLENLKIVTGQGSSEWYVAHASAAQRAEAFLRTLNLWTD